MAGYIPIHIEMSIWKYIDCLTLKKMLLQQNPNLFYSQRYSLATTFHNLRPTHKLIQIFCVHGNVAMIQKYIYEGTFPAQYIKYGECLFSPKKFYAQLHTEFTASGNSG